MKTSNNLQVNQQKGTTKRRKQDGADRSAERDGAGENQRKKRSGPVVAPARPKPKERKQRSKRSSGAAQRAQEPMNRLQSSTNEQRRKLNGDDAGQHFTPQNPTVEESKIRRLKECDFPTEAQKKALCEFVEEQLRVGLFGLLEQYDKEVKAILPKAISDPANRQAFDENKDKNRYKDVVCLGPSRIILKDGREGDYIHANAVSGPPLIANFICTQGPTEATIQDFWRMVVQERARHIFMLCELVENGKQKCDPYWPIIEGEIMNVGDFKLKNCSIQKVDKHINVSMIEITDQRNGARTTVGHHNWVTWPDKNIPKSRLAVFRLLKVARSTRTGVCVVHCSAGIGRTGTFVAVEYVLQSILDLRETDLVQCVRNIREMRMSSVQVEIQYVFIVVAIGSFAINQGCLSEASKKQFEIFVKDFEEYVQNKEKRMNERIERMKKEKVPSAEPVDIVARSPAPDDIEAPTAIDVLPSPDQPPTPSFCGVTSENKSPNPKTSSAETEMKACATQMFDVGNNGRSTFTNTNDENADTPPKDRKPGGQSAEREGCKQSSAVPTLKTMRLPVMEAKDRNSGGSNNSGMASIRLLFQQKLVSARSLPKRAPPKNQRRIMSVEDRFGSKSYVTGQENNQRKSRRSSKEESGSVKMKLTKEKRNSNESSESANLKVGQLTKEKRNSNESSESANLKIGQVVTTNGRAKCASKEQTGSSMMKPNKDKRSSNESSQESTNPKINKDKRSSNESSQESANLKVNDRRKRMSDEEANYSPSRE